MVVMHSDETAGNEWIIGEVIVPVYNDDTG